MKAFEFVYESKKLHPHQKKVEHFINWVAKKLHLKSIPSIEFSYNEKLARSKHRTGYFNKEKDHIYVYAGHRNLVDIFRTLAHELTHDKQGEQGRIHGHSSPGSPNEVNADAKAGYLMKLYLKLHPETIDGELSENDDWFDDKPLTPEVATEIADYIDDYINDGEGWPTPDEIIDMDRWAAYSNDLLAIYRNIPPAPYGDIHHDIEKFVDALRNFEPGGLEVDEGWKDWAAAGALGTALAFGGAGDAMAKQIPTKAPTALSQISKKDVAKTVTGNPHEVLLKKTAEQSGIRGSELTAFLAQCAHETLDFKHMKEIGGKLDFKKYDPRFAPRKAKVLGNVNPGDGAKYKGRGYIQLTGRDNYKRAGEALGLPLEQKPELVERPDIAAKVAVWYWKNRVAPKVGNFNDVKSVTKKINPGLKHIDQRQDRFKDFKVAMK